VISLVIATLLVAGIGVAAAGDGELPGDRDVAHAVQRLDGQLFEWLAMVGNAVGSTVGGLVAISVLILVAALLRAGKDLFFLITLLALRLLATQLKPIFESPRPTSDLVEIHGSFDGSGFPSGHALTGMTMALGLSIIVWRWARHRTVAMALTIALMLLALLIGLARIWSGAHWPSDVVGGYAFGVMIVAVAVLVRDRQPWFTR
jgi:membrane-associated phospholipid phosphatase